MLSTKFGIHGGGTDLQLLALGERFDHHGVVLRVLRDELGRPTTEQPVGVGLGSYVLHLRPRVLLGVIESIPRAASAPACRAGRRRSGRGAAPSSSTPRSLPTGYEWRPTPQQGTSRGVSRSFGSGTSLVTKASLNQTTVLMSKIMGIERKAAEVYAAVSKPQGGVRGRQLPRRRCRRGTAGWGTRGSAG